MRYWSEWGYVFTHWRISGKISKWVSEYIPSQSCTAVVVWTNPTAFYRDNKVLNWVHWTGNETTGLSYMRLLDWVWGCCSTLQFLIEQCLSIHHLTHHHTVHILWIQTLDQEIKCNIIIIFVLVSITLALMIMVYCENAVFSAADKWTCHTTIRFRHPRKIFTVVHLYLLLYCRKHNILVDFTPFAPLKWRQFRVGVTGPEPQYYITM